MTAADLLDGGHDAYMFFKARGDRRGRVLCEEDSSNGVCLREHIRHIATPPGYLSCLPFRIPGFSGCI